MELSSSSIKKFLIFSYILRNGKPSTLPPPPLPPPREKNFICFYIAILILKFLTFWDMKLFIPSLKNIKKIHPRNCLTLSEK